MSHVHKFKTQEAQKSRIVQSGMMYRLSAPTFSTPATRSNDKMKRVFFAAGLSLFLASAGGFVALSIFHEREVQAVSATSAAPAGVAPVEMVDVLVPTEPIEKGRLLESVLFTPTQKPRFAIGESAVHSFDQIQGMYAKSFVPAQQPITFDQVTNERPTNEVVQNIPSGYRAIAISVNATSSVEGWARAGAYVDVHWITDVNGERTAALIVENAKVLSAQRQVNQDVESGVPVPATVTLLTSERDAKKIGLATTDGQVVLHLRGSSDAGKATGGASAISLRDLMGGTARPSAQAVEGYVKVTEADGTSREMAVINGQLVKKPN